MKRKIIPIAAAALFTLTGAALADNTRHGATAGAHAGMSAHGMTHDSVRDLQQALQAKGHNVGPIDGIMGPRTSAALREYQRAQGYDATGRPDDRTRASLGITASASTAAPGTTGIGTGMGQGAGVGERPMMRPEDRQPNPAADAPASGSGAYTR